MPNKDKQKHLANRRAWWAKNGAKENAKRRAVTGEKHERKKARNRAWYADMSKEQRAALKNYMYSYSLKRRLNITLTRWLSIFAQQGERCACCKRTDAGGKRWHTDHDHNTGEIRGILCCSCNTTLGRLGDNLRAAEEATARLLGYLKGAEPVWKDGVRGGTLLPWEPRS